VIVTNMDIFPERSNVAAMTVQYLTDDQGRKTAVVIPIAEYDQLMEDVEDLACVAERRDDERISLASVKARLVEDGLLPH
jgi:PHD/YefM family antitoxin component YafN of YafNO toxin-antitoxin module